MPFPAPYTRPSACRDTFRQGSSVCLDIQQVKGVVAKRPKCTDTCSSGMPTNCQQTGLKDSQQGRGVVFSMKRKATHAHATKTAKRRAVRRKQRRAVYCLAIPSCSSTMPHDSALHPGTQC